MVALKNLVAALAAVATTTTAAPFNSSTLANSPEDTDSNLAPYIIEEVSISTNHTKRDHWGNKDHPYPEVGTPWHQTCATDAAIANAKWRLSCKWRPYSVLLYWKRCWRHAPSVKKCCNGESSDFCTHFWPQERLDGTTERNYCTAERNGLRHTIYEDQLCRCYDDPHCHNW